MRRNTLSAALTSVIALTLVAGVAVAQDVKSVGANPSSDQLIQALSPAPGTPPLKFRGIRLLTAKAAAEPEARAPAVALDIKFALNSAELTPEAKETVKQLATAIKSDQLASYHFLLEGHTDSTGSHDHNVELSKRRADSVRHYLVATYGIAAARLEAVGKGPDAPLDPADPANAVNRRVQIVNLGQ
jgi:outer membrane protein OmpA-like peptidoglycan-associated protein